MLKSSEQTEAKKEGRKIVKFRISDKTTLLSNFMAFSEYVKNSLPLLYTGQIFNLNKDLRIRGFK